MDIEKVFVENDRVTVLDVDLNSQQVPYLNRTGTVIESTPLIATVKFFDNKTVLFFHWKLQASVTPLVKWIADETNTTTTG